MEKKQLLQNNNGFVGFYPDTHVPCFDITINIGDDTITDNYLFTQTISLDDTFIDTFNKVNEKDYALLRLNITGNNITGANVPMFIGYKGSKTLYFRESTIQNPDKDYERIYIRNINITSIDVEAKTATLEFIHRRLINNHIDFFDSGNYKTSWNTYRIVKGDNGGKETLVLISDCSILYNEAETTALEDARSFGIGGFGIYTRSELSGESLPRLMPLYIQAVIGYNKDFPRLYTSNFNVKPQIVKYQDKYYVAIKFGTISGGVLDIIGQSINLLDNFIYINYETIGVVPTGVEVIDDDVKYFDAENLKYDRKNLLATSDRDGYMAKEDKAKIDKILTNGDGTKFLSNNGTYKAIEAGDKTNVLILSLEDDLANGQKNSPVDAEVSTALKDAISTGKACVIKSANSDILANLQQIGNNVTIVIEQISRVGQTFVAVNTTITVNTTTNVISDYQTGAIVLETEGDGNKFLSNDGTYKESNYTKIEATNFIDFLAKHDNGDVVNVDTYNEIINTIRTADYSKNNIAIYNNEIYNILYNDSGVNEVIVFVKNYTNSVGSVLNRVYGINIESIGNFVKNYFVELTGTGNGNQFLSNDGTYKNVPQPNLSNYLSKTNTTSYTPTANYHPATKKYVDDYIYDYSLLPAARLEVIKTSFSMTENTGGTTNINTDRNGTFFIDISISFKETTIKDSIIIDNTKAGTTSRKNIYYNSNANDKYFILITATVTGDTNIRISALVIEHILTESEYAALGTAPNTNNVLYFITPD